IGAVAAGKMTEAELTELENVACPGAGACAGQYTANTMAMTIELLGLSPMGYGSIHAIDPRKEKASEDAGRLVVDVFKRGLKPSDILTKASFENAIAGAAASGGSTNIVLHGLAMAREAGIALDIDDFDRVSRRTPLFVDMRPGGRYG